MGGSPKRGASNGGHVWSRGRVILVAVLALQVVLVVCFMKAPRLIFARSAVDSAAVDDSAPASSSQGSWLWRTFVISTTAPNCTDANGRVVTEAVKGTSIKCGDRSSLLRLKWLEPKRDPTNVASGHALRKANATTLSTNNVTTSHGAVPELREGRTRRGAGSRNARNESIAVEDLRGAGRGRVQVRRNLPARGPAMAREMSTTLRPRRDYTADIRSSLERDNLRSRGRTVGYGDRQRSRRASNASAAIVAPVDRIRALDDESSSIASVDRIQASDASAAIAPVDRIQASDDVRSAIAPVDRIRASDHASAALAPVDRIQASNASAAIAPVDRIQASDDERSAIAPVDRIRASDHASAALAPVDRIQASNASAAIATVDRIRASDDESAAIAPAAGIRASDVSASMHVSNSVAPEARTRVSALVSYEKEPDEPPEDEEPDEEEPQEADPDVVIAVSNVSFGGRRGPLPSFNANRSSNTSSEIGTRNTSSEIATSPNTSLEISISPSTSSDQISEEFVKRNSTSLKTLEQAPSPLDAQSAPQNASLGDTTTSESLNTTSGASNATCARGLIYVYTLPKKFNTELLENCSQLLAWGDRCRELSNSGLGPALGASALRIRHSDGKQGNDSSDGGPWYGTDQFNGEVIFHNRILAHPCRTHNPELANAFYVPYYGGLDVTRFLYNVTDKTFTSADRDKLGSELVQWLTRRPYWNRRQGSDHFLFLGRITWNFRRNGNRGRGSGLIRMPEMANVTKLALERSPWDDTEMAIPYPTGFHPRNDGEVVQWQESLRTTRRDLLFSFAGGKRKEFANDFRVALFEQCARAERCEVLDCEQRKCDSDALAITKLFMRSMFCLQPRGDSFTRRSIFDAVIAGCIPVFFWTKNAYLQYNWHFPADYASYSVFISKQDIRSGVQIEDVLRKIPPAKVAQMQATVVDMIPRLVYAPHGLTKFRDAFDTTVDKVMANFEESRNSNTSNATVSPNVAIEQAAPAPATNSTPVVTARA